MTKPVEIAQKRAARAAKEAAKEAESQTKEVKRAMKRLITGLIGQPDGKEKWSRRRQNGMRSLGICNAQNYKTWSSEEAEEFHSAVS